MTKALGLQSWSMRPKVWLTRAAPVIATTSAWRIWRPAGVDRPTHVEFCLNGELSIGASGGGSATKTAADAVVQNAYVRIRPFQGRGIVKGYADPFETQIR